MKQEMFLSFTTATLAIGIFAFAQPALAGEKEKEANQTYARQQLAGLSAVPKFIAAGPPFDARKVMAGKSILSIPGPSNDPWYEHVLEGMQDAAAAVGYDFSVFRNKGQLSQYRQGLAFAVTAKPTLVDLLAGPDPRVLKTEIDAVKAVGIKVVVSHDFGMEDVVPNVDYNLGVDYNRAGRLLADWVITKDTRAHVLVLVSDEIASAEPTKKGISAEFDQYGGRHIQYRFVNVPIAEWESGIKPVVKSAIAADPKLTYIICIYDSMAQFIAPAIAEAKAEGKVKLIGFNGTPLALDLIRAGKMEMVLGESLAWAGYAIADAEMRILNGEGAVKSMNIPFRIFTKDNAAEAGVPAGFDKGYGDTFKNEYARLWKLE
ncbi:MAG TPA: sugar ABC transporter substrate-binding protein [Thermoanaerobaculia bacterium]|nr:sugar ABC transporter substrate-binding protein [Thermoanaerobaculia bacterium]